MGPKNIQGGTTSVELFFFWVVVVPSISLLWRYTLHELNLGVGGLFRYIYIFVHAYIAKATFKG